jgi:hypothetical protein
MKDPLAQQMWWGPLAWKGVGMAKVEPLGHIAPKYKFTVVWGPEKYLLPGP